MDTQNDAIFEAYIKKTYHFLVSIYVRFRGGGDFGENKWIQQPTAR